MKISFQFIFLDDKFYNKDNTWTYLTFSKPRYNKNIILNADDSKDKSVLIKSMSLS